MPRRPIRGCTPSGRDAATAGEAGTLARTAGRRAYAGPPPRGTRWPGLARPPGRGVPRSDGPGTGPVRPAPMSRVAGSASRCSARTYAWRSRPRSSSAAPQSVPRSGSSGAASRTSAARAASRAGHSSSGALRKAPKPARKRADGRAAPSGHLIGRGGGRPFAREKMSWTGSSQTADRTGERSPGARSVGQAWVAAGPPRASWLPTGAGRDAWRVACGRGGSRVGPGQEGPSRRNPTLSVTW